MLITISRNRDHDRPESVITIARNPHYQAKLPELKQYEGKFVLIHEDRIIDTFTSYDDALKEGYKQFGLKPFLVKQILAIEPVFCFTRPIGATRKAS